jgi:hypothetical protein
MTLQGKEAGVIEPARGSEVPGVCLRGHIFEGGSKSSHTHAQAANSSSIVSNGNSQFLLILVRECVCLLVAVCGRTASAKRSSNPFSCAPILGIADHGAAKSQIALVHSGNVTFIELTVNFHQLTFRPFSEIYWKNLVSFSRVAITSTFECLTCECFSKDGSYRGNSPKQNIVPQTTALNG